MCSGIDPRMLATAIIIGLSRGAGILLELVYCFWTAKFKYEDLECH